MVGQIDFNFLFVAVCIFNADERSIAADAFGIAFGDQYNDVEMLEVAGTSYAMATAAPGIAYYADYVTRSVEEVVEDVLAAV